MTRHKSFGKGSKSKNTEPITFDLYDETFTAIPALQGAVLIDFVGATSSDNPSQSAAVILDFFEEVLEDESYKRFQALTHSKDEIVDINDLSDIVAWLIEQYSGNLPEDPSGV